MYYPFFSIIIYMGTGIKKTIDKMINGALWQVRKNKVQYIGNFIVTYEYSLE